MHVIAAKAVCLHEAMQPSFKAYQKQIVLNAAALAEGMKRNGFRLVSGGTDNHLMLVDVGARGVTGKECQAALDQAGITVNKNTIPFETRSPFQASGIRLGTPAVTTRGMAEAEMAAVADMISEVLLDLKNVEAIAKVRQRVRELTGAVPAALLSRLARPALILQLTHGALTRRARCAKVCLNLVQDFPCQIEG